MKNTVRLKLFVLVIVSFFFLCMLTTSACAMPIWETPVSGPDLTDSRDSNGNGITGNGAWDNGGFSLSWVVSFDSSTNYWSYLYTATITSKDISHFILEVTEDNLGFNSYGGSSPYGDDEPKTFQSTGSSGSEPNMPNPFYGIKFDFGTDEDNNKFSVDYTLITDRSPVWGVFYSKDGNANDPLPTAWSNALNFSDYKTNATLTTKDFIVRPDGAGSMPVPEPSTFILVGIGLLGLGFYGRRRMKK